MTLKIYKTRDSLQLAMKFTFIIWLSIRRAWTNFKDGLDRAYSISCVKLVQMTARRFQAHLYIHKQIPLIAIMLAFMITELTTVPHCTQGVTVCCGDSSKSQYIALGVMNKCEVFWMEAVVGIIIPQRLGLSHVTVSTEQKRHEIQTSRDLMGVKCKGVKVKVRRFDSYSVRESTNTG